MRRYLAPAALSAGMALAAPQTAEAGPIFYPGIKAEMKRILEDPATQCGEPVELPDYTLWVCGNGEDTLEFTEPQRNFGPQNPARIETSDGFALTYTGDKCVFDRPEESLLGGDQYLAKKRCIQIGYEVRDLVAEKLGEVIPRIPALSPSEN